MKRASKPDDVSDEAVKHAAAAWKTRIDAGLSAAEHEELRQWCDADERHRAALQRFDAVWERFDRPFNAGAADELMEELERRSARRQRRRLGVALSLGLTVALVSVWSWPRLTRQPAGAISSEVAVLRLPAREVLEDGSIVELKEGAEVAVEYTAQRRRVTLRRGEAYFQVVRDVSRPFSVQANGVLAEALGTAFTVDLHSHRVDVLVTSGVVAVTDAEAPPADAPATSGSVPGSAPHRAVRLEGGKRCVVGTSEATGPEIEIMPVPEGEMDARLAWRAPRVEFTRATLAEALKALNRYAAEQTPSGLRPQRFVLEDESIAEVRVSGLFRLDKTDAFVRLLENGFGIEARHGEAGEIRLKRAAH